MANKINILSLDGGGIRGLVPAVVMQYVEEKLRELSNNPHARIADFFDLVVGTSTGGILSCFYLSPSALPKPEGPSSKYPASIAIDFYLDHGKSIFNDSRKNTWLSLRSIVNATRYNHESIENIFYQEFGDLKMSQLLKPCVVTTYDISRGNAFFFNSREKKEKERDFYVRDVARSTSAAPTYFEPAIIKNLISGEQMVNIDGGVFANNPAMCAYAEARHTLFEKLPERFPTAKDLQILSIGTGSRGPDIPEDVYQSGRWSVIKWARATPDIMMAGAVDTVDFQIKRIFAALDLANCLNFKRVDVPLAAKEKIDYSYDMADASSSNMKKLLMAGEAALAQSQEPKDGEVTLDAFLLKIFEESNRD